MSDLEELKNAVLKKFAIEEKNISEQDWRNLSKEEKKKCYFSEGYCFYKQKIDIPSEDFDYFLALKSFEAQMETKEAMIEANAAIFTIKNIIVFIFVVNIIASILLFILYAKMF